MRTCRISDGTCCPYCGSKEGFTSVWIVRWRRTEFYDGTGHTPEDEVVSKGRKGRCVTCGKNFRVNRQRSLDNRQPSVFPKTRKGISALIHKTLWSEEAYALISIKGAGWTDGGCWLLGEAFKRYLGNVDLYAVYSPGGPEHIVVKVPGRDIYIDADGISTEAELLKRISKEEGVRGELTVALFNPGDATITGNGIYLWQHVSEVEAFLRASFGDSSLFLHTISQTKGGSLV